MIVTEREREREREREAETQAEGEAGSMQGARHGIRSQVSRIAPWAKGRHQTAAPPRDPWPGVLKAKSTHGWFILAKDVYMSGVCRSFLWLRNKDSFLEIIVLLMMTDQSVWFGCLFLKKTLSKAALLKVSTSVKSAVESEQGTCISDSPRWDTDCIKKGQLQGCLGVL